MKSKRGLTLIEVMVAISIASLLTLGIERLLDTALTSWRIAIEEVSISKLSEDMMRQMTEGDDQFSGLRDAAQLIDAGKAAVTFVPMWTDVFDLLPRDGKFYLTKRLRPGAPPPMSEVKFKGARDYVVYPVLVKAEEGTNKQYGEFGFPIKPGATVRFSYQPDVKVHPELIMKYEWDSKLGKIRRFYNRIVHDFNEREEAVKTTAVEFSYLDGGNQAVDIEGRTLSKANALVRISSVKIDLEMQGKQMTKRAVTLVNLRSLGKGGQGVILSKGLEIPLPDSEHVKLLQLAHFTGVQEGQILEFKVTQGKSSQVWRLKLHLGADGAIPVLRRLEVFYPSSELVYKEEGPSPLDNGLDLLFLGEGNYDYDDDEGVVDKVNFTGPQITLSVLQTDPEGVTLIVRP